jgi:superfamily II DNA or RNA helicase
MLEIFSFAHHPVDAAVVRGVLKYLDLSIYKARVQLDRDTVDVSLAAGDCSNALCAVVNHGGDACRIECDTDLRHCVRLRLMVDPARIDAYLANGSFPAEEHLIHLAQLVWREARVPATPITDAPPHELAHTSAWRDEHTLFAHQARTVAWMEALERAAPLTISYSGNLRITDTWFLDTEGECFTQEPSMREAQIGGGICADGTGSGKTATLLRLVAGTPRCTTGGYETNGTLVIVPLNLVSQWQNEVRKFLNGVRIIFLVTGKELRALDMQQLVAADLVVTTFYFFRSKAYSELFDAALGGRQRTRPAISAWARTSDHSEPIIEAVLWRRVVVDELHETFDSPRDLRQLRLLRARMIWGLTATPVLDTEQAQQLYLLLCREKNHHPNLLARVISTAVARHTPDMLDGTTRSLEWVDLPPEERTQLLHANTLAETVRRCTVGESAAEEQARYARKEASRLKVEAFERTVRIHESTARALELTSGEPLAQAAIESHARDLSAARALLASERAKFEQLDATDRLVRARLAELGADTARRGTKMTKIGELLASLDEPCILFVQWKSMVRGACSFLRALGLRVLLLDGNAAQRAATLAEFNTSGVLLLCLEECFAGLHLPHVRCVVFAHAIVGDRAQVENLERQAIARCARTGQTETVRVHSFLISGSDEETLWFRTH